MSLLQKVTLDDSVSIQVLPFADHDPTLTFKWMHPGRTALKCKESELTVEKVAKANCKDFYTCEISKDGKPSFSVYYCIRLKSKLNFVYKLTVYIDSTLCL